MLAGYKRADTELPLYIAGSGWQVDEPNIVTLGYVEDEELSAWYSGATALLFPSLHECFGLPAVEAIECGTTPTVSNRYALPEVAGGQGVLCDPTDPDDIARGIEQAIARETPAGATFSWQETAKHLERIYTQL
jgi:glycosyltransferase involved in cell wall biosynthesis